MSEHLKAKTARIGSHHHHPVGLYSEETYERERYIAFDPTTDRRLAEQNGQDPEFVEKVCTDVCQVISPLFCIASCILQFTVH